MEISWSIQKSLSHSFADGIRLPNFRRILAFPIWLFKANNCGYTNLARNLSRNLAGKMSNPGLPVEFYTKAGSSGAACEA
jgi:hypothetical protein